jgi:hypothetical protein
MNRVIYAAAGAAGTTPLGQTENPTGKLDAQRGDIGCHAAAVAHSKKFALSESCNWIQSERRPYLKFEIAAASEICGAV